MLVTHETATATDGVNGVVLLGSARGVEQSSYAATFPRLGLALVAYLLLDCPGGRASREEVGAFLWEKAGRARQAGNLRQLLFRVRGAEIAADMRLLETTAAEIILSPRNVSIDLSRFQAAINSAGGLDVAAACEAYSGDLLAGFAARGKGTRELGGAPARDAARRIPDRVDPLCRGRRTARSNRRRSSPPCACWKSIRARRSPIAR